jgi:outer membrane protein TolC
MFNIPWPGKLTTAGRRALEEARAAGLRFEKAKFELQRRVIEAYQDWALLGERIRIGETRVALLGAVRAAAEGRTSAGRGAQYEFLEARTQEELAVNALETLRARIPMELARLNALAGRAPADPLGLPSRMPEPRLCAHTEADLLRLAAERSPEVLALGREIEAGKEGLRLAELEYVPDFSLSGGTDLGGVAQTLGGMITVPILRHEAIRGGIEEARARLEASSAMRRQTSRDAAARMLGDLRGLSDAERQIALFRSSILPRADMAVASSRAGYSSGAVSLRDLLESSYTLLDAREMLAQLQAEREKLLADLEALAAVNVEERVERERME